jgi:hypothetical protein
MPPMSARAELARAILKNFAQGGALSAGDAIQLRNWAVRPEDSVLPLEEIASHFGPGRKPTRRKLARLSDSLSFFNRPKQNSISTLRPHYQDSASGFPRSASWYSPK